METIAVYWEPKPKTYGLQTVSHLSLLNVGIQPEEMAHWGLWLFELANLDIGFHLVLIKYSNENALRLYLLMAEAGAQQLTTYFDKQIQPKFEKKFTLTSPVELISFYGPHFGDRYGIADAALKALNDHQISILLAACSGAAIYLVIPKDKRQAAETALAEAFIIA